MSHGVTVPNELADLIAQAVAKAVADAGFGTGADYLQHADLYGELDLLNVLNSTVTGHMTGHTQHPAQRPGLERVTNENQFSHLRHATKNQPTPHAPLNRTSHALPLNQNVFMLSGLSRPWKITANPAD